MTLRELRCGAVLVVAVACLWAAAAPALAAPVTVNFESGALAGQQVTNQYGPPGMPAGPTFEKGSDAGFTGLNCGPPTLRNDVATHSAGNAVRLDGCGAAEFWPTAGFFALGYSTDSVGYWVAIDAHTLSSTHIISTAFDPDGNKVGSAIDTVVTPQTGATYYHVTFNSASFNIAY